MTMTINNNSNSIELNREVIEIDFAIEFKDSIKNSKLITFKDDELKNIIEKADDDKLIVVTSTINSPKEIINVNLYDEEFLRRVL